MYFCTYSFSSVSLCLLVLTGHAISVHVFTKPLCLCRHTCVWICKWATYLWIPHRACPQDSQQHHRLPVGGGAEGVVAKKEVQSLWFGQKIHLLHSALEDVSPTKSPPLAYCLPATLTDFLYCERVFHWYAGSSNCPPECFLLSITVTYSHYWHMQTSWCYHCSCYSVPVLYLPFNEMALMIFL